MSTPNGRPLAAAEVGFVRWLLENGEAGARDHLPEVDHLRVVDQCSCGCASIDFTTDMSGTTNFVADFGMTAPDDLPAGVFLFTRNGKLAGLDVWSFGAPISTLPVPESLVLLPCR